MVTPAACIPSSPGSESIAGAVSVASRPVSVCVTVHQIFFFSSAASIVQRAKCDQRR